MTHKEKKHFDILNDFANSHTLSNGIEVVISSCHKTFKPKPGFDSARYEDAVMLSSLLAGAESFMWFLERNGYEIKRTRRSIK